MGPQSRLRFGLAITFLSNSRLPGFIISACSISWTVSGVGEQPTQASILLALSRADGGRSLLIRTSTRE